MTTQQLRDDLNNRIGNLDPRLLSIYTAHVGLAQLRREAQAVALAELLWQSCQGIIPIADAAASCSKFGGFFVQGGTETIKLTKIETALACIEAAPDFAEAMALVSPLVSERDRLTEQIATEHAERAAAIGAAEEAHRLALAKAQAQAESDPAVITAKARLTELEAPQPLIRGRQKLPLAV
jgi:hypothetical protein